MQIRKKLRRWTLISLLILALLGFFFGRTTFLWVRAWFRDQPVPHTIPAGFVDDASRLNSTAVAEVWSIPAEPAVAEEQLRRLLQRARDQHLKVAIAGAKHSMGGHTIYPEGIVVDMLPFNQMRLDTAKVILHVGAGARWKEVVPFLDAQGFSVAVMQSNHDFSVGGSISVNCHGWQHNQPPIASTVQSFRLMKADGSIVRCSRDDNAELFSLTLGGYGLFGIILDAELRVVPNVRYRAEVEILPAENYVNRFAEKVNGAPDIGMAFTRLCVVPGEPLFLREAIFTVFRHSPCKTEEIPALKTLALGSLRREAFRAQIDSNAGKEVRWKAEKTLAHLTTQKLFSRNQLMHEGVEVYQEQNSDRSDILHEYFVPPRQVEAFLQKARSIIPMHNVELLNVTLRNVHEDRDTFLRYADREMFGLVMLFNQWRTPEAEKAMEELTRELIDAVLACEGRYYLTYRLHASKEQFHRAYPQAATFFERKRHYDPDGIFQNQFFAKYGMQLRGEMDNTFAANQ